MTMTTLRRLIPSVFYLALVFSFGSKAFANPAGYAFPETGLIVSPELAGEKSFSFDFRLATVSFDGQPAPLGSTRLSSFLDSAEYDFGVARVSYGSASPGLLQRITIAEPAIRGKAGAPVVIGFEFTVDGDLRPTQDGYFVKLLIYHVSN